VALNDCDSVRGLLAGYLYDELSAADKRLVEAHLAGCGGCREALATMKKTSGLLDAWVLTPMPRRAAPAPTRRASRPRAASPAAASFPAIGWAAAAAVLLVALAYSLVSSSTKSDPAPAQAFRPAPEPSPLPSTPAALETAKKEAREEIDRLEAERLRSRERLRQIEREFEQILKDKKDEARRQAIAKIEEERKTTEEALDRAQDSQLKAEKKLVQAESKGTVAVVAQLDWVQGEVNFLTPSGKVPAKSKVFVSGYGLETVGANSMAVLTFPDATRIELSPATTIRELSDGPGGKVLDLVAGSIRAEVARQPAERPLTLRTPDAEARVLGTRFRLSCQETTRLDVHEGKVRLSRPKDGASVEVSGGSTATTGAPRMYSKPLREVAFQDGVSPLATYAGTRDSFIEESVPAHNYGTNPTIQVDGDNPGGSGRELRMVLRWDTSAIPPGSKVQSATVVLHLLSRAVPPYEVHGIRKSWTETDVCWQSTAADQGAPVLGYALPVTPVEYAFPLNADGIALLQSWIDAPASNFGLMLSAPKNSYGLQAHARETADPSKRPKLVVTYTPR
jgi:ferric-dicitrate binding protein FerR (iron transport regulator)